MPTVTFSLKTSQWEALESASNPGESQNLAAKRIFLNALGDDSPAQTPDPDRLENLEERLEKLESELKSLALQFSERVYELSQKQTMDLCPLNSAVENLEKMAFSMQVALDSRLSEIERRLDSTPSAAVPTPTRLPKATKRKTQETPNSGETP